MYFVWLLFHHPEPPRMSFRLLLLLPHCNKIYRRCDSKTNYKMCVIGSSLKYWQAIYGIDLKTYSIDLHLGASECRLNRRYSRKQQPNWLIAECREFRYTGSQTHYPPKPQQTIDLKNSTSVSICSLSVVRRPCVAAAAVFENWLLTKKIYGLNGEIVYDRTYEISLFCHTTKDWSFFSGLYP